jgi:tetratricopeptide (TPR) repeat protein
VLSQYLQDGILQVGFTMEASFHYLLSMELTPGNIRERVQGSPFWEAPARYRLWEASHAADNGLLFELIDDIHFPNHLTAFALAQYIVLHGPGKALDLLLMEPTEQDWEAISLAAKQLRDSRPREYRLLADTFLERVQQQGYPVSSDRLAAFLSEAEKALADAIHASFIREHPPVSVEGMKSLAEYHTKYGRNREALACLQGAVDHPQSDTEGRISLHLGMADEYDALGQFEPGMEEIRKARGLYQANVSSDIILEGDIGFCEAKQLQSKALFHQALDMLRKVEEAYARKLGLYHTKSLLTNYEICKCYKALGRLKEGSLLAEQCVKNSERFLGTLNVIYSDFVQHLGDIRNELGKYDEALEKYEEVLHIEKECFGETHPYIAGSFSRIGGIWETKGEYDKALGYFEKNLSINLEYYGESHPNVAASYNRLGGIWETKGEYDKALGYFEKDLAISIEYYGESHPNVAITYNKIGLFQIRLSRFSEAITFLRLAYDILNKIHPSSHPTIGSVKKNIAHALIELHRFDEAQVLLLESIDVLSNSGIPHDPRLAKSYQHLAKLYRYRVEHLEAESSVDKAIDIFIEENGEDHINTAEAYFEKAMVLTSAGRTDEARLYFEKCHTIRLSRLGNSHPDTQAAAAMLKTE